MTINIRVPVQLDAQLRIARDLQDAGAALDDTALLTGLSASYLRKVLPPAFERKYRFESPANLITRNRAPFYSVHSMLYIHALLNELDLNPVRDTGALILAAWRSYLARSVVTPDDVAVKVSLPRAVAIYSALMQGSLLKHHCTECSASYLSTDTGADLCPICAHTTTVECSECHNAFVMFHAVPKTGTGPRAYCCQACQS
jgi:hypothetical protein